MKKLFAALLALVSSVALATTTVPVQLINPVGSTSGQAIVSTGASSAPAWGNVTVSGLASIAANTVVANVTGSSAAPTAFAMPSCGTSSPALLWTPGTGFTCKASLAHLKYNNSSGQSIPNNAYTTVTTWTSVFDANSNFAASTGIFTAPATGYYRITCQLIWGTLGTGGAIAAGLFIGASGAPDSASYAGTPSSTTTNAVQVNATLSLASGNTVTCKAFQNSGSAATLSTSVPQVQISIDQLP